VKWASVPRWETVDLGPFALRVRLKTIVHFQGLANRRARMRMLAIVAAKCLVADGGKRADIAAATDSLERVSSARRLLDATEE
jgi:hypothetical protein